MTKLIDKFLYHFGILCLLLAFASSVSLVVVELASGSSSEDALQARITKLEDRLLDLQCRHVLFEDGSTLHGDAERTAECFYTGGK